MRPGRPLPAASPLPHPARPAVRLCTGPGTRGCACGAGAVPARPPASLAPQPPSPRRPVARAAAVAQSRHPGGPERGQRPPDRAGVDTPVPAPPLPSSAPCSAQGPRARGNRAVTGEMLQAEPEHQGHRDVYWGWSRAQTKPKRGRAPRPPHASRRLPVPCAPHSLPVPLGLRSRPSIWPSIWLQSAE